MALTNHDKTFEGGIHEGWPPAPWLAMLMLRWLFVPVNRRLWRFSACDSYGRPKELPFA